MSAPVSKHCKSETRGSVTEQEVRQKQIRRGKGAENRESKEIRILKI